MILNGKHSKTKKAFLIKGVYFLLGLPGTLNTRIPLTKTKTLGSFVFGRVEIGGKDD